LAVKPGDILGKYRIDALIGRGGMGHVFAATDIEGPGPSVAIKVVSKVVFDDTLMARLHREAEAAARIRSDYVPRVLEISDTAEHELFLVMERLVGEPLSQRMRDKGVLAWSEVEKIGEDILRGLIDAHTAGVVHRDLKPSNVFLALRGGRVRAMVLDFGVCKLDTVDSEHLTGTGEAIGTVAYMAPEQIRGASKVDDRADLYAFGVLVFEMLCARLPHDGPSQMAILASKLENEAARLNECTRVDVPAGLDALMAKALVRDPKQRFASAQELLKAWRKLGAPVARTRATADMEESSHDPYDAPTTRDVEREEDDDAVTSHGGGSNPSSSSDVGAVPVEPHPTQTALTAPGISLRRGGSGRVAVLLAAAALVAGVISVGAFFARGPDGVSANAGAGANASASANPEPNGASTTSTSTIAPPEAVVEIDDGNGESPAPVSKTDPKKLAPRVRARPAAAPKSSAPHITSQPRY
jgi:serine/threonine-protein kinase